MNSQPPNHLTELLNQYYHADERTALRLEDEILACIENFIKKRINAECAIQEDREDFYQQARINILKGMRAYRKTGTPINSLLSLASLIISHVVQEQARRDSPEDKMARDVRYYVMKSPFKERFARWQVLKAWFIGLKSWMEKPYVKTNRYTSFCRDATPFIQQAFGARNPAVPGQVKLWELLLKFLEWIETPLEEPILVTHLLKLQAVTPLKIVPLESADNDDQSALSQEPGTTDSYPCLAGMNWEHCWKVICARSPKGRAVLLLKLEPEMLVALTGQTDPRPLLAPLLGMSLKKLNDIWDTLPLEDEDIAQLLNTTEGAVYTARSRCKEQIQDQADRPSTL